MEIIFTDVMLFVVVNVLHMFGSYHRLLLEGIASRKCVCLSLCI